MTAFRAQLLRTQSLKMKCHLTISPAEWLWQVAKLLVFQWLTRAARILVVMCRIIAWPSVSALFLETDVVHDALLLVVCVSSTYMQRDWVSERVSEWVQSYSIQTIVMRSQQDKKLQTTTASTITRTSRSESNRCRQMCECCPFTYHDSSAWD